MTTMLVRTAAAFCLAAAVLHSPALGQVSPTTFAYQGRVNNGGSPFAGPLNLRCSLWESPTSTLPTLQIGGFQLLTNVTPVNGVFAANLDFGPIPMPDANGLWLQIEIEQPSGSGQYTAVTPRQAFVPPPVAMYAFNTRGITVDSSGRVGIGTSTPQFPIQFISAGSLELSTTGGSVVRLDPRSGGGGTTGANGGDALMTGGVGQGSVTSGAGGAVTIRGGNGGNGVQAGAGGQLTLEAGSAGSGVYAANGANLVLRAGDASSVHSSGAPGVDGEIRAESSFVVDLSGPSSMKIGKSNTSVNGNTTLILATTAATNGYCYVQGVGSAGSSFGQLVLNPDGGVVAKPGGGMFALYSDARLKTDIRPMIGTLDKLLQLRGHTFRYTDEARSTRPTLAGEQIGLIAQEVQQVFPDWIDTDPDGFLMVTERSTTALMVESLRELRNEKDAQLRDQQNQLAELRAENVELKARLDRLERAIAK